MKGGSSLEESLVSLPALMSSRFPRLLQCRTKGLQMRTCMLEMPRRKRSPSLKRCADKVGNTMRNFLPPT